MTSLMEVPSAERPTRTNPPTPLELSPISGEFALPSTHAPTTPRPNLQRMKRKARLRKIFAVLTLLSLLALIIDGVLAFFVFRQDDTQGMTARPTLKLSASEASRGQVVEVSMNHFAARARVRLTRDVQEAVRIDQVIEQQKTTYVQVDTTGQAKVRLRIDERWDAGSHLVVAEDVATRYVASASLQIVGAGPERPPNLHLSQDVFDMGSSLQGSNSIQSLHLSNTGGGSISWVANSDRSWLQLTPMRGTFSSGQTVLLATSRSGLRPGNYTGSIVLVSSTGSSLKVTVKMAVKPLPDDPGPVLSVTPGALSFIGFDGAADPAEQTLMISNPGNRTLHWSLASQVQMASLSEVTGFQTRLDWLSMQPERGSVEPGKTQVVHIRAKSQALLPDVYSGVVSLQADQKTLNNPQSLALSLAVRPSCEVVTNSERLVLHANAGQQKGQDQHLQLSVAPSCKGKVDWQATSRNDWLMLSPARGSIEGRGRANMTLNVDATHLKEGSYIGSLVIATAQSSQSISVQAVVSPPGTLPGSAGLIISPSQLNFNVVQGQTSNTSQNVVIANTGPLDLTLRAIGGAPWLQLDEREGILPVGKTINASVHVVTDNLAPGSYSTSVQITATDNNGQMVAGGSETLTVTLIVAQPCIMSITPDSLSFQASLLDSSLPSQTISIRETGTCSRPVTWNASTDEQWISLTSSTGVDNGDGSQVTVNVSTKWKLLGTYQGHITFVAYDSNGNAIAGSPRVITVTLHMG